MVTKEEKRRFALRGEDDEGESVFDGDTPRHAALEAARELDPAPSEKDAEETTIRLREEGTDKVHVYKGWAWTEEAPENTPQWMPDDVTEVNVSKEGIRSETGWK